MGEKNIIGSNYDDEYRHWLKGWYCDVLDWEDYISNKYLSIILIRVGDD